MTKLLFVMILFTVSCKNTISKKTERKVENDPVVALSTLQGKWESCFISGGSDGDYKITHNFSNNNYVFTELYYASHDGSCTDAIVETVANHTVVEGETTSINFPEAISIDVTFSSARKMKALTADADGLQRVTDCTGESNPIVGTSYDITQNDCNWPTITNDAVTMGTKIYSIAVIDYAKTPNTLSLGSSSNPEDGTTANRRHEYMDASEYEKQ